MSSANIIVMVFLWLLILTIAVEGMIRGRQGASIARFTIGLAAMALLLGIMYLLFS